MSASGFVRRFLALLRKETRQLLRDRSNLAVGLLLPVLLILLFGYGLSFDVTDAPVAIVLEDRSPQARDVLSGLQGSPFIAPVWMTNMAEAVAAMRAGTVRGVVRIPVDFTRQLALGQAQVQLLLNGVDTNTAFTIESYVSGAIGVWGERQADRAGGGAGPGVVVVPRMWFNEASSSTWYLVPGLIALVLTLIGAFLTSLLIAREWERGTLEALFVTPVRPLELVLAKLAPYLVIGTIDLVMCLIAARFLFEVPIRGSLGAIVLVSVLYLIVSLALGLFISGVTRNQFQASQLALLASFLPAMMLSGFIFDLRNMPIAIQVVSQLLPATHFMPLIKTLFLAGNNWPMVAREGSILAIYGVVLIAASRRSLRKRLV
ncbi:MAG TPA: ABC transporter permease [Vicinamibacterales bacterium]|jgi:ABC-2 type transport system permease protein